MDIYYLLLNTTNHLLFYEFSIRFLCVTLFALMPFCDTIFYYLHESTLVRCIREKDYYN